jgi:dTDP-4-dehydrorhamnose reductase
MKVLILGANGMLGHKLVEILSPRFEVWATVRESENESSRIITGVEAESICTVREAILRVKPDVVINSIGVIKQMESSKNVVKALTVNSIFPHLVAEITKEIGARFITISTDCVFSGEKGNYTEDDISDARDVYGKSKNLGEVVADTCLTIRTSIIGHELNSSHSLLDWFLSNEGGSVKGFKNAVFSGFPTVILAEVIGDIIADFPSLQGLYHISSDPINKFDLLTIVKEIYNAKIEIIPKEEFCIDRSLDSTKFRNITGFTPKSWVDMIKVMESNRGLRI